MAEKFYSTLEETGFSFKDYVLALPSWYPTSFDPYPGDFNQRHIMAASLYKPQVVLYIGKDQTRTISTVTVTINKLSDTIVEVRVIYPCKENPYIDALYSNATYINLLYKHAAMIRKAFGKPLLLHSYIVIRGGLGALLLSRKWRIPYVLTENWTIYYPEDPGYLKKRNPIFRFTVNQVFKNLAMFLPVSNNLKEKVNQLTPSVPTRVIPNVVDTDIFFYKEDPHPLGKFRFIHISTMTYQKNPEGLLRQFKAFSALNPNVCLWMVGPYTDEVLAYSKSLNFDEDTLHFTGGVEYKQVPGLLQSSQALVLFSRYENLPCVILESLCCGVPVISTDVGGVAEVLNDDNGILIRNENENELLTALQTMYVQNHVYTKSKIAEDARVTYSYKAVGKTMNEVYVNL